MGESAGRVLTGGNNNVGIGRGTLLSFTSGFNNMSWKQ